MKYVFSDLPDLVLETFLSDCNNGANGSSVATSSESLPYVAVDCESFLASFIGFGSEKTKIFDKYLLKKDF